MGEVNPEESLEVGPGVFKGLGDCTGAELESAIRLIAQGASTTRGSPNTKRIGLQEAAY